MDRRITYWDLERSKIMRQLQAGQEVDVPCMALSADGELIVVGDSSGELKVFTATDCRLVHIETVHSAGISAIAISPDNTLIITADEIGHMFFWRL
jgi:WD40 repeat protein